MVRQTIIQYIFPEINGIHFWFALSSYYAERIEEGNFKEDIKSLLINEEEKIAILFFMSFLLRNQRIERV